MSRIDEMPEHRARLPRSTHDLSHSFGFTAASAHLLPVFHAVMDAGDTMRLAVNFNLRTQPLQAAAMEDIDVHVEYFFVPMFLLYQPFGSIYYGIMDEFSSNFSQTELTQAGIHFPVFDWSDIHQDLVSKRNTRPYVQNGVAIGETLGQMAYRLLDHFHFNVPSYFYSSTVSTWNPNVFPYQLLAYHCIYQYYYRLDNREKFDPTTFNWDKFLNQTLTPIGSQDLDVSKLFLLHYRPMSSDYFTDVKVSPIVDVLNLSEKQVLPVVNQWLTRSRFLETYTSLNRDILSSGSTGSLTASPNSGQGPNGQIATNFGFDDDKYQVSSGDYIMLNGADINTANIRALFANEKLWSVTGRAKKHYDDQTMAHFGYKVPHDAKHEISCFGHDVTQIHIGEVISTAQTDQADLGTIAGKGYAHLGSNPHTFKAPCHGVVMAIMSIVPHLRYAGTFGKENVMTNRFDLPQPEYDHLGMQPLFMYESNPDDPDHTDIMNWQYRYEQFKRRYNRTTKIFESGSSLSSWMIATQPYLTEQRNLANTPSYIDFLYQPGYLNKIFLAQYVNTWSTAFDEDASLIYDQDPFVVNSFIDCKLNSWMSDYSLPRLES